MRVPVIVASDLREAALQSDVVVTCTPSRSPLLHAADVRPGSFVAGVGADHPEKHELGASPGRRSAEETILFDSTGVALQDVAAAALVYERAVESGRGLPVSLAD